jgi:hypothetical protein
VDYDEMPMFPGDFDGLPDTARLDVLPAGLEAAFAAAMNRYKLAVEAESELAIKGAMLDILIFIQYSLLRGWHIDPKDGGVKPYGEEE